jgi:hypothetical protein
MLKLIIQTKKDKNYVLTLISGFWGSKIDSGLEGRLAEKKETRR